MMNMKRTITKDEIAQCKEMLQKIEANPYAPGFLEPVDWKGTIKIKLYSIESIGLPPNC